MSPERASVGEEGKVIPCRWTENKTHGNQLHLHVKCSNTACTALVAGYVTDKVLMLITYNFSVYRFTVYCTLINLHGLVHM